MQAARGTAIGPDPDRRRRRRGARLVFLAVALAGLVVDAVTKAIAAAKLDPSDPPVLFGGLLRLQLIRNSGAAFSLGENVTIVFALLSLLVLLFVVVRLVPRVAHRGWAVALGLLSAGVSGNLADRIFREPSPLRGRVVDFLELPHWPIFNVADMCITSAAVLIVVLAIVKGVGLDGVVHTRAAQQAAGSPTSPTSPTSGTPAPREPSSGRGERREG